MDLNDSESLVPTSELLGSAGDASIPVEGLDRPPRMW